MSARAFLLPARFLVRLFRAGALTLISAMVIVVSIIVGWVDEATEGFSTAEGAALAVAVVLLLGVRARRVVHIRSFANLVSGEGQERFESVARCMPEQLDLELRRINRLSLDEALGPERAYARAVRRGEQPGGKKRRHSHKRQQLRLGSGSSGVEGLNSEAEVGSVSVGPLRLPLRWLIDLATRPFAQVITGSVFAVGAELVVAVEHSRGHKWEARCVGAGRDPTAAVPELARELAAQIVWDLDASSEGGDDWRPFRCLIDGLDDFRRYQQTKSADDLDQAEKALVAAVADNWAFASAYYNLGLVRDEQSWLSGRGDDAAVAIWEHTLLLDPAHADACLALGRSAHLAGNLGLAIDRYERTILLLRRTGRPTHRARYQLAAALFDRGTAGERGGEAAEQHRRALREARLAARELRRARRLERVAGSLPSELVEFDHLLADVSSLRAAIFFERGGQGRRFADRWHRHRALRARLSGVRLRPDSAAHHSWLARTLIEVGDLRRGLDEAMHAAELDPWSFEARNALSAGFGAAGDFEKSAHIARSALDVEAVYAYEWQLAAERTAKSADEVADVDVSARLNASATELAGIAVALAPESPACRETLAAAVAAADPAAHDIPELTREWIDGWIELRHGATSAHEADIARVVGLTKALRAQGRPEVMLTANEIGRLCRGVERYEDAVDWFGRALQWFDAADCSGLPGFELPPVDWVFDVADSSADVGRWEDADREYERVLLRPLGWTELESNRRTIRVYPEAAASPVRARALAGRAEVALNLRRLDDALRFSSEATSLEPAYAFPYRTRASALVERGHREEAVAVWAWLAEHAPWFAPEAHSRIGDIRLLQAWDEREPEKRSVLFSEAATAYHRALRRHERAIENGDKSPLVEAAARAQLSSSLRQLGKTGEALSELETAAEIAGDDAALSWVHDDLASAYEEAGRIAEAEATLMRARDAAAKALEQRELQPAESEPRLFTAAADRLNSLAWFRAQHEARLAEAQRDAARATTLAARALELDETAANRELLANCHGTLGWVRLRQQDHAGAIQALEYAQAIVPVSIRRSLLARVFEIRAQSTDDERCRAGFYAMARQHWRRILELDPESTFATEAAKRFEDRSDPLNEAKPTTVE